MKPETSLDQPVRSPFNNVSLLGAALILLGVLLLLSKLGVVVLGWRKIVWVFGMAAGGYLVTRGFVRDRRGPIFWGSLLFFVSLYYVLWLWWVVDRDFLLWLPSMSIALGLSYLMIYLYQSSRVGALIAAALFVGGGIVGTLWWWEYLEWFEVEDALRTYWPLALVALGVALLTRRR